MKVNHILGLVRWLVLMLVLFFLFVKSGWFLLLAALLLLFLLPYLSLFWNILAVRKNGEEGKKVKLQILRSGSKGEESCLKVSAPECRIPVLGKFYVALHILNELTGEEERYVKLLPREEWVFTIPHCGRIKLEAEKLWLTDYLGMIPMRLKQKSSVRMTVLPDTFPVKVDSSLLLSAAEDSDLYESDRRGNDPTEIFQLREYVPGDMVRSIHWKLSSKLDQLIVKEPALPVDRSLLIYWNQSEGSPAVMDTLAETVFSLCQALSGSGYAYTLGWMEEGFLRLAEITDMDALLEHLPMLLHRKLGELRTSPDFSAWGKVLYFTGAMTEISYEDKLHTFLCKDTMEALEGVTVFTPENYKDKFYELETY